MKELCPWDIRRQRPLELMSLGENVMLRPLMPLDEISSDVLKGPTGLPGLYRFIDTWGTTVRICSVHILLGP